MGSYSTQTRLKPEEAIERARAYFGKGGLGLEEKEIGYCCVRFEGGGGHVMVTAAEEGGKTTLDLETREWDYQVRKFMEEIHS